ncbi:MAG: hypothetical protein GEV06_03025 [Luteitalea sp.]|nr:hypothetical protein [Luteitalea sp.]
MSSLGTNGSSTPDVGATPAAASPATPRAHSWSAPLAGSKPAPTPGGGASAFPKGLNTTAWSRALAVAFRFGFIYLTLYNTVTLANVSPALVPGLSSLVRGYMTMWQQIVPWVGAHILNLRSPITYFPSGSGDKTSDWVLLFCYLVLTVVATMIWSAVDWRRPHYRWPNLPETTAHTEAPNARRPRSYVPS